MPIYEQLVAQIIDQIESRKLKPGEPLPSVRCLAKQTGVANNTIAKAYNELELRGYIKVYGNKGAFVLEQSVPDLNDPLMEELDSLISRLINKGNKSHIIRRIVEEILNKHELNIK